MATTTSQTPVASVAAPPTSSGLNMQSTSESPSIPGPSPSLPANGPVNGLSTAIVSNTDGPSGGTTDMKVYPRDGRVRNPVPSKLKNVNEQMKGNFSVMHMDVASHRASEGRDAAAKRTSESTALQAKLAQTDTYVSHQRRANYPRHGLKQFNTTPPTSAAKPAEQGEGPARPLTVAETKAEQARLLTLLRSLPHATIVDQICKGLAFFGGIPDAPPPADGKFPESELANGPGSLFVGWIAEIFPDIDRPRTSFKSAEPTFSNPNAQKRPRGRPKGSKATKSRSDKGIKKGSQKSAKGGDNQTQDPQDDSWVDVEDSVLELNDNGDLVEAVASLVNASTTTPLAALGGGLQASTPMNTSTGFRSINDIQTTPTSSAKKRGRPKGSKNRPKDRSVSQSGPPPKVTPVPVPIPMIDTQPQNKGNAAKPKATKNRPKPATEPTNEPAPIPQQQSAESGVPSTAPMNFPDAQNTMALNGGATLNQANNRPGQIVQPSTQPPASQVKASTVTAKKRKRPVATNAPPRESTPVIGGAPSNPSQDLTNTSQMLPSPQLQNQAVQALQQSAPAAPAMKRARKSQEASNATVARRQTPNNLNQMASNPPPPTIADAINQPNTADIMTSSQRPAEGLELHYVAMQNNQNNQRPQHQQSHSSNTIGSTASPALATAPAPVEGLEAHYEHFAPYPSVSDNSRQTAPSRQQQRTTQTASPIPSQTAKLPQMPNPLPSQQQQPRPSQNYYSQSQPLSSTYNPQQQPSYTTNQRSQPHLSNNSSNTGLVQHTTNSPQFSAQSNSPLMQTDNNYRGSPSLIHNSAFTTRRTPSASPLDGGNFRSNTATGHVANHSPHFTTRPTSAATTSHNTSHAGLPSSFPTFSDSSLFDMGLDSSGGHGSLGMGGNSYGLGSGAVPQQQRTSSSTTAPLYSPSAMNNNYLGSTNMGRTSQNRWGS
ncbi:hypothetical protein F5Y16DRAFT_319404 [Xylariaceae sp. FL0255]|nr:hypothetical protein F5Y16DRAFT_319404 [Xylariaceae sp. FL0255]